MQREDVLQITLELLEQQGFAALSFERVARKLAVSANALKPFWPDYQALLYDCLHYHGQKIDVWRRQLLLDEHLTPTQKLLARYDKLAEHVNNGRYPGCLFISACSFFPEDDHPIHQLAEQQKQSSLHFTRQLLQRMDTDDIEMVAHQMELIQEGCLSKLLVKRQLHDIAIAKKLAEDVLQVAHCRRHGALS